MEEKDPLKALLGNLDQVNQSIDLESVILKSIEQQELRKSKIKRYRTKGNQALKFSLVLIIVLGVLFSLPDNVSSFQKAVFTYFSITLMLLILFVQLEVSGKFLLNNK